MGIINIKNDTVIFTPSLPGRITAENEKIPLSGAFAECSWEINRYGLCITVCVPNNMRGMLRVPFADNISANDTMVWIYGLESNSENIRFESIETIETGDKFIWFELSSGTYCFNLK